MQFDERRDVGSYIVALLLLLLDVETQRSAQFSSREIQSIQRAPRVDVRLLSENILGNQTVQRFFSRFLRHLKGRERRRLCIIVRIALLNY